MIGRNALLGWFLISLGGQVCQAADLTARTAHVGFLMPGMPNPVFDAFLQGMNDLGYVEGENLLVEQRWAMGKFEDLPHLSQELVDRKVDIIVTVTTNAALAARQVTKTIPIVIAASADPVGNGLAASLARPGGNVTGLTIMIEELSVKRLELLKEVVPRARHIAVLTSAVTENTRKQMQAVAPKLKVQLDFINVSIRTGLDLALQQIATGRYDAIFAFEDPIIWTSAKQIAAFATAHRLPGIYGGAKFARSGGLMSYGPSLDEMFRAAAGYVDRILKGASPGDLPIEQPRKFELVVNLKTASALGITIPKSVLLRADEVIR